MRCLVLGSTGFLGEHLVAAALRSGHAVRSYDRRPRPTPTAGLEAHTGSLLDREAQRRAAAGTEVAFYLAWDGYPGTERTLTEDLAVNVGPAVAAFKALADAGVTKVIFASSGGTIYGPPESVPIPEDHPTRPTSVYGLHKKLAEEYLAFLHRRQVLDSVVLRPGNLYGPGQLPGRGQGLVATALGRIAQDLPLEVWGDGSSIRDYVYVEDAARAFLAAAEHGRPGRAYNVGAGRGWSIRQVVAAIETLLGRPPEVRYASPQPGSVAINVLDTSRARDELGWSPAVGLEEGLSRTWRWIIDEWLPAHR
jgi:UDP-glucose 4-epimerase